MATVHNPHLAGQKTSSSRFGELEFDKKGNCEVDDDTARIIEKMAMRGWKVSGIAPDDEIDGAVDDEDLDDEDLDEVSGEVGDDETQAAEGADAADPSAPKLPKKKKKKGKKNRHQ